MAYNLPGSEFVGIDSSPRQIDRGRQTVAALGLTNIDLRRGSILDVDAGFGRFDYIVCHGVYSWVPAEVRQGILAACKANLAADGVAYVSYNTYPGWHLRGVIRDMMTFHVRMLSDPGERIRQARALVKLLTEAVGAPDTPYGSVLRSEADLLARSSDNYVYHDHLEEVNAPVYFYQFAELAAARGLQYLAEAQPSPLPHTVSAEACNTLLGLSQSLIQAEQYLDFVRNRTFRRSLLCHDHVELQRPPQGEAVTALYLAGPGRSAGRLNEAAAVGSEEFRGPDHSVWTDYPALRAALRCLAEVWPAALAFDALWERVRARLPHAGGDGDRRSLPQALLDCYLAGMVELHLRPPALAVEAGERPRASALAQFQAAAGQPLSNLRHRTVALDLFDRLVLQQLDGTRGRPALVEALAGLVASGAITVQQGGAAVHDPAAIREALRQSLGASLDRLAGSALLVAAERA
jgi:methyltransferase-like protein